MNFGHSSTYQPLLSTLILVGFITLILVVQACVADKTPPNDSITLFDPDSLRVHSTSKTSESLSATKTKGAILLSYTGAQNRVGKVRIYDAENTLVYGEKDLELVAGKITRVNFENAPSESYQLFVFFDDGEFLLTTVEVPEK